MDDHPQLRDLIKETLTGKSNLQQKIFDNTFGVFNDLKEVLHEMSAELHDELEGQLDKRIKIEYRDRGKFECQLQVAGDMIIFIMHTDIYEFNREHEIWNNPYVQEEPRNAYCGMIDMYNFLGDSFKYNRAADTGYLIGRLFVNHDMRYCVEGKRQANLRHDCFGSRRIDREALLGIVETAILYSLDFHLLVPPYDNVKLVTVEQMNTKFEHTKLHTGKRMGYKFNVDDV
ncbi:MAG: hypothetical protein FWE10_04490 [Rikenellaceae bacterium]|nr:hypothetical protein [Rikenellaceae bacterium]MCL2692864.1 hypothetical protein [Rikenellaceae bacterium]